MEYDLSVETMEFSKGLKELVDLDLGQGFLGTCSVWIWLAMLASLGFWV